MSAVFVEDQVEVRSENDIAESSVAQGGRDVVRAMDPAVELGIWLSGLESFLLGARSVFGVSIGPSDRSKEFRLVAAGLQRCLMLKAKAFPNLGMWAAVPGSPASDDLDELGKVLRNSLLLSDGLISATSLDDGDWKAWSDLLTSRFRSLRAFSQLIELAERDGRTNLPGCLGDLANKQGFLSAEHSELALVLPRFGVVLKWLEVVGRMLKADEPLKSTLLIFARVNEQISDLTNHINGRLELFANEEADLFASLDAAAYTASIELKKVYSQELAGIARMRPSPSIYARVETAYSLLNEGFQQMLAGFAKLIDPSVEIFELFPAFQQKLDQSLVLRREILALNRIVQIAEKHPEKAQVEQMQAALRDFLDGTVKFLFYKDTETVERFVEEILITKQNKDLVPLLHRFGAYLETLLGQVSLRAVLEKHPVETPRSL